VNTVYDVIIIGSGAGGAAATYQLARSGRNILVLEKGDRLPRDGSTLDVGIVIREGRFANRDPWLDRRGRSFTPDEHYNLGGKTKWYGAALLRFAPNEFTSDAQHQCRGWPFGYDELAPYYDQAETLLRVRRFEPEPDTARIVARIKQASPGWRSAPMPLGLSSHILDDIREVTRFDGFASALGFKSDAECCLIDRIRERPNVTIKPGAAVQTLVGDNIAPTRITGVVMQDGTFHHARSVLIGAGALSSPRLVEHYLGTTGLAKKLPAAAMVGRNYKSHILTAVVAWSRMPTNDLLRKTVYLTHDRFMHSTVQPLGAALTQGEIIATELPRFVPRWFADYVGGRACGFFLQTEDGSHPDNRVIAAANGDGRPRLDYDRNRIAPGRDEHRRFVRAFARDLLRAGMIPIIKPVPLGGTAHACGTLIAGDDPANSVVNADGCVHGMENLYVVDGSALPRSSRVNPALTIYAWALRVADKLDQSLGATR
jgi:choline dehydrogenase-like flavoprotein